MNTRHLLAIVALASAGSAFAQEATSDAWMNAASTKTRAQVLAELQQARADGSIKAVSAGYIEATRPSLSRAEVAAAVRQARASGELARIDAEAHGFDRADQGVSAPARLARAGR